MKLVKSFCNLFSHSPQHRHNVHTSNVYGDILKLRFNILTSGSPSKIMLTDTGGRNGVIFVTQKKLKN
jgi:hypothetical protein